MSDLLVWMDMEMTGLDPDRERIIELAIIVTDGELNTLVEGPELVLHQPEEILAAMDDWNTQHHTASGLVERVRASTIDEAAAEAAVLAFLDQVLLQHTAAPSPGQAPARPVLAGNSIHQDRRFIRRYLPNLDRRLHYRMVDVSTVKELVKRWYPDVSDARPMKNEVHRALDDIRESIAELRYYRDRAFAPRPPMLD